MIQKDWLVAEAKKLSDDINSLHTDIAVMERKFQVEVVDADNTLPLGKHEWSTFKTTVSDACMTMIEQLDDFIDNRYGRQLHWSALRLLAASGVLSSEIDSYQSRLAYIVKNPSEKSQKVEMFHDYFLARLQPTGSRFALRVTQLLTRVMDPDTWSLEADLTASGDTNGNVRLKLAFKPNTKQRRREELEREKRLKRLQIDD